MPLDLSYLQRRIEHELQVNLALNINTIEALAEKMMQLVRQELGA